MADTLTPAPPNPLHGSANLGVTFSPRCPSASHCPTASRAPIPPPSPFPSFILNEETADWVSPLGAAPELTEEQITSRSFYRWDEDAYQADNTTGWVLETP
jgi:hypothetical protein